MFKNQKIRVIFLALTILISNFLIINHAKAQPAAISDLNCVFSEMPGAVWLTWTAPVGANSYDVRYFPGAFDASTYNLAYQFSQNWSGSTQEGLITDLANSKTWFFAMKAIDSSNNYSAISNVAYCFVPAVFSNVDIIPPSSSITDPQNGATILVNQAYIIKGDSSDSGGSSVKEVEISFDEGKDWFKTNPLESNNTSGFTWNFTWQNPALGTYHLITRATDWAGNIETPGSGIRVTVANQQAIPPEKPISEMSVLELKAKITEIQQQIIQLLTQLIQLTQSQISQIKK